MIPDAVIELRRALHACPELSGAEHRTRAMLIDFLHSHTDFTIHPCGDGFYAAYRAATPTCGAAALRADYDALELSGGGASHLCGHDGHAAALCGAALRVQAERPARDVFFLFQPAEETGAGAQGCLSLFRQEQIQEIYGAHNLPGFPLGQVITRPGTFACASRGLILRLTGKPTHAAYPENGISPASAVGQLLTTLPELSAPARYTGMTLCTVIGVRMGEKAFGAAAASAEIWLTLRAEHDCDLSMLQRDILSYARSLACTQQLHFTFEEQDVFPATENDPGCTDKVLTRCHGQLLSSPMRWSEDFGHYLRHCRGAFFGIGAGIDHPALHTEHYEYPDALLQPTIEAFLALIRT